MSTIDENILKSLETLAETMRDKRASIAAATDDLERKMATMRDSQTVQPLESQTTNNQEK